MSNAIVPTEVTGRAERDTTPDPTEPTVGQWYWVKGEKRHWLGCVVHLGTNFAELEGIDGDSHRTARVHNNDFASSCTPEPDAKTVIATTVNKHRLKVAQLMGEIQDVTKQLAVSMGPKALTSSPSEETAALALRSSQSDKAVKQYKHALIKAKEKTLPALFKEIEEENKLMAKWLQADLIPLKAQADGMKPVIEAIEGRIFNVELYAGLVEETEKVRDGKPASPSEKLHLFQRRHYMDEECLAHYETGGMNFKHLKAFDAWLAKEPQFSRIFPKPRCIVAFRIRRLDYDYLKGVADWRSFIELAFAAGSMKEADKQTYLYIRNGEQLWRLVTDINFDAKLFPDEDRQKLLTGQLYAKEDGHRKYKVITEHEYKGLRTADAEALWRYRAKKRAWRIEKAKADAENAAALKVWEEQWDAWAATNPEKLSAKEKRERRTNTYWRLDGEPVRPDTRWVSEPMWIRGTSHAYQPWTRDNVYWDDIADSVKADLDRHNRLVLVLQGLFDRSLALHPHAPVQLWHAEGFNKALALVYDSDRALVSGPKPDFEAYRARLNALLKPGDVTTGQQLFWERREAKRYNEDQRRNRRGDNHYDVATYRPAGNPGPGELARVMAIGKRSSACTFKWQRARQESGSWSYYERRRVRERIRESPFIGCSVQVPLAELFNVTAYKPGDFKQFFDDPRTRADYLKWAPYLLLAEEYHAGNRKVAPMSDPSGT